MASFFPDLLQNHGKGSKIGSSISGTELEIKWSWIFIRRTDVETPILWPPDVKSWVIGKDPDAGKDLRQEKKRMKEDEMLGWHHHLNRLDELEQTPGDSGGQRSLVCCSPRGHSQTWLSNWTTTANSTKGYTINNSRPNHLQKFEKTFSLNILRLPHVGSPCSRKNLLGQ